MGLREDSDELKFKEGLYRDIKFGKRRDHKDSDLQENGKAQKLRRMYYCLSLENPRPGIGTPILSPRRRKKAMSRWLQYSLILPTMKRSMPRCSLKLLEGGEPLEITGAFPPGVLGDTKANLRAAAEGEMFENTKMYPGFSGIARDEGIL